MTNYHVIIMILEEAIVIFPFQYILKNDDKKNGIWIKRVRCDCWVSSKLPVGRGEGKTQSSLQWIPRKKMAAFPSITCSYCRRFELLYTVYQRWAKLWPGRHSQSQLWCKVLFLTYLATLALFTFRKTSKIMVRQLWYFPTFRILYRFHPFVTLKFSTRAEIGPKSCGLTLKFSTRAGIGP